MTLEWHLTFHGTCPCSSGLFLLCQDALWHLHTSCAPNVTSFFTRPVLAIFSWKMTTLLTSTTTAQMWTVVTQVEVKFVNGHRNSHHVLRHHGHASLLPTSQSLGFQHTQPTQHRPNQHMHNTADSNDNNELISQFLMTNIDPSANTADQLSSNEP